MKTFLTVAWISAAGIVAAAVALLLATLLVIGLGKGVRALVRRASAHRAAADASAEQASIPVLLDLRTPRREAER